MILLKRWIQKIQDIIRSSDEILFRHISRCYNALAYTLSIVVISHKFGLVRFQEFLEGTMIFESETNLIDKSSGYDVISFRMDYSTFLTGKDTFLLF